MVYQMEAHQLKALADAEFDRALHRKNIKENAMAQMTVPFAGGLFLASKDLIAYLSVESAEIVYIEDLHGNPIKATRVEMLTAVRKVYNQAMQAWHEEHQSSNRIRRAQNV